MHVMIREPGYLAARARQPPVGAYARRKEARVLSVSFRRTSSPETPSHAHSRGPLQSPVRSRGSLAALVRAGWMMMSVLVSVAALADAGPVTGIVVDSS